MVVRFTVLMITTLFVFSVVPGICFGQNKVVVIPLVENKAVGDATPDDVIEGKTFSSDEGLGLAGTLPVVGQQNITPGTTEKTITKGYHDGTGTVTTDAALKSENIKRGATIFGVGGKNEVIDTSDSTSPVTADRMRTGDVAFVNGEKVTGTGTQSINPDNTAFPAGYYEAGNLSTIDEDLASVNIRFGATILGVKGEDVCLSTTAVDELQHAVYNDCLSGEGGWGTLTPPGPSVCRDIAETVVRNVLTCNP